MTPNTGRKQRVGGWLGVVCVGLIAAPSAMGQQFKPRPTLWGGGIRALPPAAFSPDGKTLVSVSLDRTNLKLWDVTTGEDIATLKGHTGTIRSVAFSPNGKTLASGDFPFDDDRRFLPGKIKLWDVATGKNTVTLEGHMQPVFSVVFSPDGKTLASASLDGCIKLWDVASGKNTANLEERVPNKSSLGLDIGLDGKGLAFSPNGKLLASVGWDETVNLWEVASGKKTAILKGHLGSAKSLAFSPDGKLLACGSGYQLFRDGFFSSHPTPPGEIKLWDVASGKNTATFNAHDYTAWSVAFSPDGKTLASGGGSIGDWTAQSVMLWDVATGKKTTSFEFHEAVLSVAFSPDGKTLVSGSASGTLVSGSANGRIKLWDVASGKNPAADKEHDDTAYSMSFSPDGKTLASGGKDKTVKLWNVALGRNTATFQGHNDFVASVAFSPDGKILASGSADRTIRLWDVTSGKDTVIFKGHTKPVTSVAFSPDGKTLASGSLEGIKLWDVTTAKNTATLRTAYSIVWSVAFSPDGKTLAAGNLDETVELWDVASRKKTATLDGHCNSVNSVAFSPDGKTLAAGSGLAFFNGPWTTSKEMRPGWITLWDVTSRKTIVTLIDGDGPIYSVAFSRDGKTLVSGGKLWDVARRRAVATLGARSMSAAFSPDGKLLAVGVDRKIELWDWPASQRPNK